MAKKPSYQERAQEYKIVTVMLHRQRDAELVAWVDSLGHGKTNDAIRQACYAAVGQANAPGSAQLQQLITASLSNHLVDVRRVVENALAGFTPAARPQPVGQPVAAGLLAALDKSLDIEL